MPAHPPVSLAELRSREFPIVHEYTYLNTATQGILPNVTRHALEQAVARAQFPGLKQAPSQASLAELARTQLSRILGAQAQDIVFTGNTTHGLNICAHGIDWHAGDNVVLPDHEFPSLMYTWLNLRAIGVEVRVVPWSGDGPSVDELMAAVDSHTRVVSCSAVAWDTGYRMDLEVLGKRCASAGCLLVVDAIQAVGSLDLDTSALRISALSCHGYKWLLSDFGIGALYVAPAAIEQIRPVFVGEQSIDAVASSHNRPQTPLAWQTGAQRYAAGGSNTFGLVALATSLGLIEQIGVSTIEAHNRGLAELLVQGLCHVPGARLVSPADPARRSTLITFTLGESVRDAALVAQLGEQGVIVAHRRRGIRVSPHWYNTAEEIEHLLEVLIELV